MSEPHIHASHPALINRLKRANGHLGSVIAMLEDGRSCVDVAQQLQAVEKAIQQAKKTLIQDHIDTAWSMRCVATTSTGMDTICRSSKKSLDTSDLLAIPPPPAHFMSEQSTC